MRGHDIPPRASRRIRSDHTSTATSEFDHRLLKDGVHDDILEDTQLALLEDAIATAEDARDRRREELADTEADYGHEVAWSVEHLQSVVGRRVMEVCAERCHTVLVDGDEWVAEGWEDQEDVDAAKQEAATWLLDREAVTARTFDENPADSTGGA